ncbi:SDR family NAD(P)-dependent oxidoreductase [Planotetraspora mira]|uniref:Retinol dehydrogenase n=1 Tax=Planotetraspora mira TaxID=58121 RepID=A0A8J3TY81_9ACTN|nr:SDR family NAD(P)-dependent oxidoreductase [Planotetraspora mira]GII33522.1 retinol dehydrogenase [Planotetraspora mira]
MTALSPHVDLTGKVSLVTGATGGMGTVITTRLARLGSTVVIAVRNPDSGEQLRRRVAAEVGADRVEVLTADLASQDDLHRLADRFTARHGALHLLINNVGAHYRQRTLNADGVEMHIAINYLAGFTLTDLLLGPLQAGTPSRVVNVASMALEDTRVVKLRRRPRPVRIDPAQLDDLRHTNPAAGWTPLDAYARGKMLTLMSGYLLAERLRDTGVTVNAVHPGLVNTGILDDIAHPLMKPILPLTRRLLLPPEEGAQATLNAAIAPELAETTGRYFHVRTEIRSPAASYDVELQQRIWEMTAAHIARGGVPK